MSRSPANKATNHAPASASEWTTHDPVSKANERISRLPFTRFERSFSSLFRTYCEDFEALAEFYAGDPWSPEVRVDAAARSASPSPEDRETVADVLEAQNTALSASSVLSEATRASLDALRDPEGVAVVTGQQVGLFGGPLYTVYKTLTTLALAERLHRETGRPVAPVFWLAGEDHDFAEIAAARLLRRNELAEVRLPEPERANEKRNTGPVGRLAPEDALQGALDALDDTLPASDFKPALMETVRRAYAPGTPLQTAFARLLRALLPEGAGLVFAHPDHHRLKARAAPLFRREIRAPRTSAEHVREAGRRLEDAGGHAQIGARPVNLFLLEEEGRLPLDLSSADDEPLFSVRGTERFVSRDELLDLLEEAPERFSPGVVLRPLMQDRLLPTAAYVAGPAEVAYHGQLGGVYEEAGVERPLVYPRASVTLLEGKVAKVLKKFDLGPADLEGDPERLFQSIVERDMEVDLDALFDAAQPPIHQALDDLKPEVEAVDGTLGPSVEATRAEIAGALDDLKAKAMRAEKRSHDEVRAQLEKARANLFPDGAPQERVVNVLYFLNKYGGAAFLDDLHDALSLDTRAHQVVSI